MLKFRNISFLRRIYVWCLGVITHVAYGPDIRAAASPENAPPFDNSRIARINSELEHGPHLWQKDYLDRTPRVAQSNSDDAFRLDDIAAPLTEGIHAIAGDTLTACFSAEPPDPWNFLTRNIPPGRWRMSAYNSLLWLVGVWARYCVFLPVRVLALIIGVGLFVMAWPLAAWVPGKARKRLMRQWLLRYLSSVVVLSWSGYVKFHGKRPEKRANQIYVANHTSLIDLFLLNKDYNFSCIGQRHSGLAGVLQDLLMTAQDHIWFDREEGNDRRVVQRLIQEHVRDENKEPMLVFPEGTCTNSAYCIMFKKGSFELGADVYPIAMRYRRRFGDPFWNSQTTSFPRHLYELMTSWAVVCDVFYMKPQRIRENETSVQFANRVRALICERAGLTSINWDGFLKRHRISDKFVDSRQRALASIITRRLSGNLPRPLSCSVLASGDDTLNQTNATGNDASGDSGMDSLGFEKPLLREGEQVSLSRNSLYRDVLTLRRRRAGGTECRSTSTNAAGGMHDGENYREGGLRNSRVAKFAENALRDTIRWALGIGLFVMAAMVTNRMMPVSWKQWLTSGFS
eukprot:GFKZ01007908.1.p1 GENE.GFKZ01007908.1~~GFKZ01007908.1.p1  ORF type:complete len:571 (+),score=48.53 GFKZ01007908.1:245-1957(+)